MERRWGWGFLVAAWIGAALLGCGGRGAGEGAPPLLHSARQNRDVGPDGTTVEFAFDKPVDATSATDPANYAGSEGQSALWAVVLPPAGDVVRVMFDGLILPGTTTVSASGVRGKNGGEMAPVAGMAVTSTDATPPAVAAAEATSVANASNDVLTVTFDDRMFPGDLEVPANFSFEHPIGTPRLLAGAAFDYDETTEVLRILFAGSGLETVNMRTGASWRLEMSGLRDLGGNAIPAGAEAAGTVGGDALAPTLIAATQNLVVDPWGRTVDLAFDEMLDADTVAGTTQYVGSGGQTAVAVASLWPGDMVRVVFDLPVLPGQDVLAVQDVFDLAGNQMAAVPDQPIASTDLVAPAIATAAATTFPGFFNDRLVVTFSEPVLPLEAETLANYVLESPIGTAVALAGSTLAYDVWTRAATVTFSGAGTEAVNLTTNAFFSVSCVGIRDVAGNPISLSGSFSGVVGGDAAAPAALSATQNPTVDPFGHTVDVLFDEPIDLAKSPGASFSASGGQILVAAATLEGSTIVRLFFDSVMPAGFTSIAVSGVEDPAGNEMGLYVLTVEGPDQVPPSIVASSATTLPDAANDWISVTFDEPVIPEETVAPANWTFESPTGTAVPLAGASFAYDPATRTLRIVLGTDVNLRTGDTYTIFASGIRDVSGNSIGSSVPSSGVVGGDATAPSVVVADRNEVADPSGRTVDVTFDESLDPTSAQTAANYTILGPSAPAVVSATLLLHGRTVRLVLDAAVTPGSHRLKVKDVRDLAGNSIPTVSGIPIAP